MFSVSKQHLQTALSILLSLVFAVGLWYVVTGSAQVEADVAVRVEYRGLSSGLLVEEGMINSVNVRLRGPAELLRSLHDRDLTYTVDLSEVRRGANVIPLEPGRLLEFKAYEVVSSRPNRLVLEVDALAEKIVPLEASVIPPGENSELRLANVLLEPSFVTVQGPEHIVRTLEKLDVNYDANREAESGPRSVNLAIVAPDLVEVTPPVTTLRYTLTAKTELLDLERLVQLDGGSMSEYTVTPPRVKLRVDVPEARMHDSSYLASIRVLARVPELARGAGARVSVLVMLPPGAHLVDVENLDVQLTRKSVPDEDRPLE
ncbi:MAG TPA: hypothetical protein H9991_00665 [Candidatus Mailhella excrementigallinarum]|nr:MAG: hypothetical protein DBY37_16350 [Desulfovibrionaceae bacterium]HIV64749.1 hypothetical protein [Candidatus Mailhella excrementigallinarum]